MALQRIKVWNTGDTLSAVDLNAEFNNLVINALASTGGILTVSSGGTGLATLTLNALYIGNTINPPTALGLGTATTVLHGAAAGPPTWGTVTLTTDVTGILPTANGGTGIAFFTAAGPTVARTYTFPDAAMSVGYLGVPVTSKSASYTTLIGDAGTCIYHPVGDNNPRTFTIDSNANVAYPIGTTITFINDINTLTIAITTDVMVLAGGVLTGSRTMATTSVATALKVTATRWVISGAGIT